MFNMCYTQFTEINLKLDHLKLQLYIVGACSDQYSYITHYFLSISIFVNYLSGCILRHATNSYMPIFNQFLHAYTCIIKRGINARVAIDRNGEECGYQEC